VPNIAIVGIARNVERCLEAEVDRLHRAFSSTGVPNFFIVESDSTDETVKALERLKDRSAHFEFKSLGRLEDEIPTRTVRLAYCRNIYHDVVVGANARKNFTHVVVADLDGVNRRLSEREVVAAMKVGDWDARFANQPDLYDDIFALRHPIWCPRDYKEDFEDLTGSMSQQLAREISLGSRAISIPKNERPIAVQSAFGGLGVYTLQAFLAARYHGTDTSGRPVCEHVPFNLHLFDKGFKLAIVPSLVNSYSRADSIGRRWRGRATRIRRASLL